MLETNYIEIFNMKKEILDEIDGDLHSFLEFWSSKQKEIYVQTSGSTGKPKKIKISKEQMIESANATIMHFNLKKKCTILCCLPLKYIGGKMMIVRALILKASIIVTKPKTNPFGIIKKKVDLLAITPLQFYNLVKKTKIFKNIKLSLIGGGEISEQIIKEIQSLPNQFYQTYGMTETISHIAVRDLKKYTESHYYKCLENNSVTTNFNDQLVINSKHLKISSLTTNDIAKVTGNKHFKLVGRVDNIINSGGFKVSSESIEKLLNKTLQNKLFFIDKIKCEKFGEKVILIAKKEIKLEELVISIRKIKDKKKRPKEVYFTNYFIYNENQKIDRSKTKIKALSSNIIHKLN